MFRKLAAEFVGTFWLVLGGCGAAVLAAGIPDVGIGLVGVSDLQACDRRAALWAGVGAKVRMQ